MPNLNSDQLAQVQNFINKLPDSLIKSQYEKWLAEVSPTQRATGEQMEYFVSRATHLPVEVQSFPQSWAAAVKNTPETEKREAVEGTKEKANLTSLVGDVISGVPDTNAPDNKEETLHKLGTEKGSTGGKKASTLKGKK